MLELLRKILYSIVIELVKKPINALLNKEQASEDSSKKKLLKNTATCLSIFIFVTGGVILLSSIYSPGITFDYSGGTPLATARLCSETGFPNLVKEGYEPIGWFFNEMRVNNIIEATQLAGSGRLRLTKRWERPRTIYFDPSGGSLVNGVYYKRNITSNTASNFVFPYAYKRYHTLTGWYFYGVRMESMSHAHNFTLANEANITLTAGWQRISTPEPTPGPEYIVAHHAFMIGFGDGSIRPNIEISRAQFATMLFRIMLDNDRAFFWSSENNFTDVAPCQWHNNAISTMYNSGFITGLPDSSFQPDRAITNAELVTALIRFLDIELADEIPMYEDSNGHWAAAYINAAALQGWEIGIENPDRQFRPNDTVTRAEAAALIMRVMNRPIIDAHTDMVMWSDNACVTAWYYMYIQMVTNSRYFIKKDEDIYETEVVLIPPRRWYLLERPNSRPEDIDRY